MDRRQRKTRDAIFHAFSELLSKKDFTNITVGEIIALSDVGRATFYAHFETKDYLLKAFCDELFCHIFDSAQHESHHEHIFKCSGADSDLLHLLQHLKNNDNNILSLLSSNNFGLFIPHFKAGLEQLLGKQTTLFDAGKWSGLPEGYWKNHTVSVFIETVKWWIENGMQESAETILAYYMRVI